MLNGILTKIFLIPHLLRFQDNTNIKTKMKNKSAIQISNNKTKKKRLTPSTTTTHVCKLNLTLEVFHSGKNIL